MEKFFEWFFINIDIMFIIFFLGLYVISCIYWKVLSFVYFYNVYFVDINYIFYIVFILGIDNNFFDFY